MKMVAEAGVSLTHHYHEDGNIQCKNHPYKNGSPGGICALCLQDKLGKLVSSSFPVAVFPSSPSPPSPPSFSFRSDASTALSLRLQSSDVSNHDDSSFHSTRNGFFSSWKKEKKKMNDLSKYNPSDNSSVSNLSSSSSAAAVLKRSKSMATRTSYLDQSSDNDTPRRRKGFWSFFVKKTDKPRNEICYAPPPGTGKNGSSFQQRQTEKNYVVVEENDSPDSTSFDRRVSRSRSVGCGSRSFSGGDLFERISTGFGDCALRRVESHREGKAKMGGSNHRSTAWGQDCAKGRVKCGGLFGGLTVVSSSSSASSTEDGKIPVAGPATAGGNKGKSWGWSFSSPMRGFGKPSSSSAAKKEASNSMKDMKDTPSLLTF